VTLLVAAVVKSSKMSEYFCNGRKFSTKWVYYTLCLGLANCQKSLYKTQVFCCYETKRTNILKFVTKKIEINRKTKIK